MIRDRECFQSKVKSNEPRLLLMKEMLSPLPLIKELPSAPFPYLRVPPYLRGLRANLLAVVEVGSAALRAVQRLLHVLLDLLNNNERDYTH